MYSQAHLDERLRGEDKAALDEYEREAELYEEELAKERELACTADFVTRHLDRVQARQQEIGYLKRSGKSSTLAAFTPGFPDADTLLRPYPR